MGRELGGPQDQRTGQRVLRLQRGQAKRGLKDPHEISLHEGYGDLSGCSFIGAWRVGVGDGVGQPRSGRRWGREDMAKHRKRRQFDCEQEMRV